MIKVSQYNEVELLQLKSLELFEGKKSRSMVNCLNSSRICGCLENNENSPVSVLQKELLRTTNESSESVEDEILGNICALVKEKNSNLACTFQSNIKNFEPDLLEKLYENADIVLDSIPPMLEKLNLEMNDSKRPMSEQGIERLSGFCEYFKKLKLDLEDEKNEEFKFELSHKHKLEIRKFVIQTYLKKSSFEELKKIILYQPEFEGLDTLEILSSKHSKYQLGKKSLQNSIFYLGVDFSLSNCLCKYPFHLLFDKKKELLMNVGHFLSLEVSKELELVLSRFLWELELNLIPYFVIMGRKKYDVSKFQTIVIRKIEDSKIQMICVDAENEKLVDLDDPTLHTTLIYKKIIQPVHAVFKKIKTVGEEVFEKEFLDSIDGEIEINGKPLNMKIFVNQFLETVKSGITKFERTDNDFKICIHKFLGLYNEYLESGIIPKKAEAEATIDEKTPFFVYGTLRPDATRSVGWNQWWNDNKKFSLDSKKGYIKNCNLLMGQYPFILFSNKKKNKKKNKKRSNSNESENWKNNICFGYIQWVKNVKIEEFMKCLHGLDRVEGYPDFYNRKLEKIYICESSGFDKEKITGKEESVSAIVYYMEKNLFEKSVEIESGDFLKFKKGKK